jgi:hypothetical protein
MGGLVASCGDVRMAVARALESKRETAMGLNRNVPERDQTAAELLESFYGMRVMIPDWRRRGMMSR